MDVVVERLLLPQLAELCLKYGVLRLSVFGSALRDDFGPKSDIDLIVNFGPAGRLSMSRQVFGLAQELEDLYGRKVDLVERRGIKNPYFRESIEEHEVSVYLA